MASPKDRPVERGSTQDRPDRFSERLRMRRQGLSARMRLVADFIDQNRSVVVSRSAIGLAHEIGVSDATVIRTVQALGFEGLVDLKEMISSSLGQLDVTAARLATTIGEMQHNSDRAITYVLEEHRQAMDHLEQPENQRAITRSIQVLAGANRIAVFGIGASGILAEYAARLFARHGITAYALNRTGIALAEQLLELARGDALIIMIRQNIHREVSVTVQEAARLDIPIIAITGQRRHALTRLCDQIIALPRASVDDAPLHGPTLACLEMLMLGVAAMAPQRSLDSLDRLLALRKAIRPRK